MQHAVVWLVTANSHFLVLRIGESSDVGGPVCKVAVPPQRETTHAGARTQTSRACRNVLLWTTTIGWRLPSDARPGEQPFRAAPLSVHR